MNQGRLSGAEDLRQDEQAARGVDSVHPPEAQAHHQAGVLVVDHPAWDGAVDKLEAETIQSRYASCRGFFLTCSRAVGISRTRNVSFYQSPTI
jgi:hypothetical protein